MEQSSLQGTRDAVHQEDNQKVPCANTSETSVPIGDRDEYDASNDGCKEQGVKERLEQEFEDAGQESSPGDVVEHTNGQEMEEQKQVTKVGYVDKKRVKPSQKKRVARRQKDAEEEEDNHLKNKYLIKLPNGWKFSCKKSNIYKTISAASPSQLSLSNRHTQKLAGGNLKMKKNKNKKMRVKP